MKAKHILKNYFMFDVLKLANGLNLKNYNFTYRNPTGFYSGTSIKKYQDFWFELPNGRAIFKTFDSNFNREIKDLRIANELLCEELCNQVGINHAHYEPANLDKDYGLVSYNIVNEKEKLVPLEKFLEHDKSLRSNLIDIGDAINHYKSLGYVIDREKTILDLYKILIFDTITMQSDRNVYNLNFIFKNSEITLAPLFDNEYAFSMEYARMFYENGKDACFENFIKNYSYNAKMLNVDHEKYYSEKAYLNNIKNITDLAKSNTEMKQVLINTIKKLNISSAIKKIEQIGYTLSKDYETYIKKIVKYTKQAILKELLKPKTPDTPALYEDYIK